jgi:hypothetical protein
MFNNDSHQSEALKRLHEAHEQITLLLPRLEMANQRFADAAKPLDNLSELDSDHRLKLASNIRAANQEWEEVTRLIAGALSIIDDGVG